MQFDLKSKCKELGQLAVVLKFARNNWGRSRNIAGLCDNTVITCTIYRVVYTKEWCGFKS
jgi:hypothetical protein